MKTMYLDEDFIGHAEYAEGRTAVETAALDHVCAAALPFYIYVPQNVEYAKPDGVIIHGEFVQCIDSRVVDLLQAQHEAQLAAIAAAYTEGVNSI